MKVVAINKKTKEEIEFEKNVTKEEAKSLCKSWKWILCDENGISYLFEMRD